MQRCPPALLPCSAAPQPSCHAALPPSPPAMQLPPTLPSLWKRTLLSDFMMPLPASRVRAGRVCHKACQGTSTGKPALPCVCRHKLPTHGEAGMLSMLVLGWAKAKSPLQRRESRQRWQCNMR
jgi:hypothetical protein